MKDYIFCVKMRDLGLSLRYFLFRLHQWSIYIFYKRNWIYFTSCTNVCQISVFRCYV